MWFKICFNISLTLLLIFFTQSISAASKGCKSFTANSSEFKQLKNININTIKNRRFQTNNINILIDPRKSILPKFKSKFLSNLTVEYSDSTKCSYQAYIRQNGDMRDHIILKNGKIFQSLDVSLLDGNINGIVKFKLLLEHTRGVKEDEIIITELLRELGFLSPRTSLVNTNINNAQSKMIFQEKSVKELIEYNLKREGPILEGNENFMFLFQSEILRDGTAQYEETYSAMERGVGLQLSKLSNSNWSMKSQNHLHISFNAISELNKIYLNFISNYKNKINNFDFQGYGLSNAMLAGNNEAFIQKLNLYNILLHSAGAEHGLLPHNRKFYWDSINQYFEPIYYDGTLDIEKSIVNQVFSKDLWLPYHGNILDDHNILIKKIKNINLDDFYKKLENKNIGIEKNLVKNKINVLIKSIETSLLNSTKIDKKLVDFNRDLSFSNNYRNILINNLKKNKLNSKFVKIINQQKGITLLDNCNVISNNCTTKAYNIYNLKDRIELRKIIESDFKNDGFFFDVDPFIISDKSDYEKIKIQTSDLIYNKRNIEIDYNSENKILKILQKEPGSRVYFNNGSLKNVSIDFKGILENELIDFPIDKFGNTGCLTFSNIEFSNVSIASKDANCEDAINIINSKGRIKDISINNTLSDALDLDFSNLFIDNVSIKNAKNDCADFSLGTYEIKNLLTEYCGDKSVSVGENSKFRAKKIVSKFSNIGIATKDGSFSLIDTINIQKTKYCTAAYNKKQEFIGGKIEINKISCEDYFEKKLLDKTSEISFQNEQFKTSIVKKKFQIDTKENLIEDIPLKDENGNFLAVIEIPKDSNEKWEISKLENNLEIDFKMGEPRIIGYGNYISNYGIIPRTFFSPRLGGDGDPLDVLVFGDRIKRGEVVKVYPIGLLRMTDFGENDFKVISVKVEDYPNINPKNVNEIFAGVYEIIEKNKDWFSKYKGLDVVKFIDYGNSYDAVNLINLSNKEFDKYGIRVF